MISTIQHEPSAPETTFPSIESILPHRGTMLLLDAVAICTDDLLLASASVDERAWYADAQGAMPAWIGIELMAQTIAAHVGLLAMRAGGTALPGVLLGSRRYIAKLPAFFGGTKLFVEAKVLLRSEGGYGAYECTIRQGQIECAEAVIKVFQPDDFQSFIEGSFQS